MSANIDLRKTLPSVKLFQHRTAKDEKNMGTISKALALVDIVALAQGPKGLTGIAIAAGFDKATTRRLLLELCGNGYLVQNAESRDYELGPALQVLGKIREERFSLYRTIAPIVRALAEHTGETVHAAEYNNGKLLSICSEESAKPLRVNMEPGEKLPLHATASGIAFLAASSPAFVDMVLSKPLAAFTPTTLTTRKAIITALHQAAARGFSVSSQSLQEGVSSVAAAVYGQAAQPIGTLAIAVPAQRMTHKLTTELGQMVSAAAADISAQLSGRKLKFKKAS
jgi:IclR family transcriptional regulator, acetate operon repressor